jgi:phage gp29-like protein
VRVVAKMLGATDSEVNALRFTFAPERPDPKERLEAVEKFVAMGGRVSEREVRDLLGLSEPKEDEPILGTAAQGNPLDAILGNGTAAQEGTPPDPNAPVTFTMKRWL